MLNKFCLFINRECVKGILRPSFYPSAQHLDYCIIFVEELTMHKLLKIIEKGIVFLCFSAKSLYFSKPRDVPIPGEVFLSSLKNLYIASV